MDFSGQRAERTASCPAQGIEAESPDDDRREEEDLQWKARPPRGAGVAPKCVDGNMAFYCFTCVGPVNGGKSGSPATSSTSNENAITRSAVRSAFSTFHFQVTLKCGTGLATGSQVTFSGH
ncbi:MAG: hypothetical protein LBH90_09030 [Tannerella sp.]|nr:hypothetical protein [Tannerella sp.]